MDDSVFNVVTRLSKFFAEVPAVHHKDGGVAAHKPIKEFIALDSVGGIWRLNGIPDTWIPSGWNQGYIEGDIFRILEVAVRSEQRGLIAVLIKDALGPLEFSKRGVAFNVEHEEFHSSGIDDLVVAHSTG